MKKHIWLIALIVGLMVSCEVEFSPNAPYKETPVVYCILNQDEDTTWARIERCYLPEGDIYSDGKVSDSINYPAGSLRVALVEHDGNKNQVGDSMFFTYTERDRRAGNFSSQSQPLYYACIQNRLQTIDTTHYFELVVRKTSNGEVIARATTQLVVSTPGTQYFIKPTGRFGFYSKHYNSQSNAEIAWNRVWNARSYQPFVRLYYSIGNDTTYLDVPCPQVWSKMNENELDSWLTRDAFLSFVQQSLQVDGEWDGVNRKYLKTVDIILTCMNEDYNAYTTSVSSTGTSLQGQASYTNIEGGRGVFGARRTDIVKRGLAADESQIENQGLVWWLMSLGCGFYVE